VWHIPAVPLLAAAFVGVAMPQPQWTRKGSEGSATESRRPSPPSRSRARQRPRC
jgi:hypothetical protein